MSAGYDDISPAWKNDVEYLRLVNELSGLPVAVWFAGKPLSAGSWTSCAGGEHPCFTHEPLRRSLEECCVGDKPSISFENDLAIYGVVPVGPLCLAIGPGAVWTSPGEPEQSYAAARGLRRVEHIAVTADILKDWQQKGDLEQYQLEQSENDRNHQIGVDFENKIIKMVESGDTEAIKALLSGPTPDYASITALEGEEGKTAEYLVVSIITLMTRAAVAGGASVETAHELGDVYLKRLGKAVQKKEAFLGLSYHAMIEFTELVRRAKEASCSQSYVEACKAYIERNLRKNLQVGDIAPAIGLSRTYLSRLFHQTEGITVQQYVQKEKCRHAAQMLQYSDYSISQIAQYFGFSSPYSLATEIVSKSWDAAIAQLPDADRRIVRARIRAAEKIAEQGADCVKRLGLEDGRAELNERYRAQRERVFEKLRGVDEKRNSIIKELNAIQADQVGARLAKDRMIDKIAKYADIDFRFAKARGRYSPRNDAERRDVADLERAEQRQFGYSQRRRELERELDELTLNALE